MTTKFQEALVTWEDARMILMVDPADLGDLIDGGVLRPARRLNGTLQSCLFHMTDCKRLAVDLGARRSRARGVTQACSDIRLLLHGPNSGSDGHRAAVEVRLGMIEQAADEVLG